MANRVEPLTSVPGYGSFGRHINHDPQSRRYRYTPRATTTLRSVRHRRYAPILDQGTLGSCTGHAALGALSTGRMYDAIQVSGKPMPYWTREMAETIYARATAIDPFQGTFPPDDTGSDGLSVAKILTADGYASGYQHTFSADEDLAALMDGPLMLGTWWYSTMSSPDPDGNVTIGAYARRVGGHEFVADELDVERERIGCTNSWGTGWGKGGRFYLPFAVWRRLRREDADVVVLIPVTAPPPKPTPPDLGALKTAWAQMEAAAANLGLR